MRDWPWQALSEIVADEPNALTDGPFGSKLKSEHYTEHGVRVVRLGNLGVGEFKDEDRSFVSVEHAANLDRHRLFEGDLLVAALAEPVGRCCEVPSAILPAVVKADCIRFRPRPDLNRRFIMYWLNSPTGRRNAEQHSHGVGRLRINMAAIRELPVPVPPRDVQDQIVATIETHFSRLDATVASLTRAKANVKRARASVLKAAVEGRLVPTEAALARAEGRDYEPASVLLEQILAERKAAWAASGARGKYKEPVKPETEGLPELPVGWVWATLEQLGEGARPFAYGVLVPGPDVPDGVPFVRVGDIGEGSVADRPEKSIARTVADKFKRTYLQGGELLLSIVGTIGRVGVASAHLKGANVARAVGVLPLVERISSQFVVFAIRSHATQHRLVGAAHEVARKTLNMEDVRATVVPVPPLAEQYRIVAEVDRRFSVLDALNATLDANLARCARLRQSVLKRAFEGRLVPADTAEG